MIPAVSFKNARVVLDTAALQLQFDITNRSSEPWLPQNGWAAGYHLFDEPTGMLVIDGDRGLIAGGFEGQDAHVYRVRTVAHTGLCFSL